jgi:dephospho-CoA kinase
MNMKRKPPSNHQMLKIGITGGIGSGKTTVCKMFEKLGVPVYYADDRAKHLMQHEHFLIDQIKKNFGDDVYVNGSLDRKALAAKVFNDKEKLALLNSLVHPAVYRDTERWIEEQKEKKIPYIIKEAALLVETGSYKALDKLIVVTAPLSDRVERITERDKSNIDEVMARVKNQLPEEEKVKLADFIITNNGALADLEVQVLKIHLKMMEESPKFEVRI